MRESVLPPARLRPGTFAAFHRIVFPLQRVVGGDHRERWSWRKDAGPAIWAYTGWTCRRENEEEEPSPLDDHTGLPTERVQRPK